MMDVGPLDSLDLMGARKDGGIDLVIVTVGKFQGTSEEQKNLLNKIQNYLNYISSKEFMKEFGKPLKERVEIKLKLESEPNPIIYQLEKKIVPWVEGFNASFTIEIEKK